MQRILTLDDRSFSVIEASAESFCLVCDTTLNVAASTNIFYTSLPRNGELLASFVLRVLRPVASDLRSSYICSRCNELFQMLEQAQWTVSNIRCEILKVYHSREGEKALEPKADLSSSQILPEELFIESEPKVVLDADKFNTLNEFRGLQDIENVNVTRTDSYGDSPSDFCNLNIEIHNVNKKIEETLEIRENEIYRSKIDCLKALDEQHTENVVKSDSFNNSTNGFCSIEVDIDSCHKKLEKTLPVIQNSAYQNKIDVNLKIEEPPEVPRKRETEANSQNCSRNPTQDLIEDISRDLLNNSIDESAESLLKETKNAQYTIRCKTCPRFFKSEKDLRSHSLRHGGARPYQCRRCEERFSDLSVATSHATTIHSSKKNCIVVATEPEENEILNFNGEDCIILEEAEKAKETPSSDKNVERASRKSGKISKYSLKPLKYPCSTCGKKWRTSAELKTHVKSHSNLRPYMCEKCGQAYKHKHALEIHVGMHNGISPYQCSVCNKCFTQKGALMRHLPMHTGEMPYQCELCGKRFIHHTSYNMHALSHTGKKSYQCHVCDLSLLSTSHLKRHMRVHTGEKPYSCELCGKSFAERYNLFAHQKIHDPVEIMAKAAKKITTKYEQCVEFLDKKQKVDENTKDRQASDSSEKKWIDHTVNVENPATTNEGFVDQTWQDNYNYGKMQSVVVGMKSAQTDNNISQISQESIAMLMSQTSYSNKGLAVVIQPTNVSVSDEIEQPQI